MNINSLGYRTDMIFHEFDGDVIDRGDYLVIRTPTNPNFYWGNFLLFSRPPQKGDFEVWRDLFAQEIGIPPQTEHQVFGWDSTEGEQGAIQPFLQAGFRPACEDVMTSRRPHAPSMRSTVVNIRALKVDDEWEQALENQVVCREPEFEENEYRVFRKNQMERYKKMVVSGLGNWYGAFIDQQLVADLGLFHDGSIGRYQSVETHPDFRRQGIASTLVYEAGVFSMIEYKLHTLVIVADQDSNAARLYASLGFQFTEKQIGVEWWREMESIRNDENGSS